MTIDRLAPLKSEPLARYDGFMTTSARREQLEAMIHDDPHDPFLRYALAMEWDGVGQHDTAIEQLRQLLVEFPEYVPGFLQVGQLLARQDRIEEARDYLSMGMQVAFKVADQHAYAEMEELLATLPPSAS